MRNFIIRLLCIILLALYICAIASPIIFRANEPEEIVEIVPEKPVVEMVVPQSAEVSVPERVETLYFDVSLDREIQDYLFFICEEYNVDPALIVAMIEKESTFRIDAVGDSGNSLGLMQIQPRWNAERMKRLECDDLLNPYENITVGVDIVAGYLDAGYSLEWTLMAYNGGPAYANNWIAQGVVSDYARTIIANAKTLERGV